MLRVAHAPGHPGELGHLGLHDRLRERLHTLAQESASPSAIALRIVSSRAILSSAIVVLLRRGFLTPTTRG